MKNILFEISQQEKNRILEMHRKSTKNLYLVNEGEGTLVGKTVNLYRAKGETQEDFAYTFKIEEVKPGDNLVTLITDKAELTLKCTDSSGALMMGVKPLYNRTLYTTIKDEYCKTTRDKGGDIKTVPNADFASTGGNMGNIG